MSELIVTKELDYSGLNCPLPVLNTHKEARAAQKGDILKIVTTDPGSQNDIPAWVRRSDHELIEMKAENDKFVFLIRI